MKKIAVKKTRETVRRYEEDIDKDAPARIDTFYEEFFGNTEKREKVVHGKKLNNADPSATEKRSVKGKTNMSSKKNKKKRRHRHKLLRGIAVAVCVVAVLALIIAVGGTLLISHYYNKMNFVEDEDVTIYDPSQLASMEGSSDDSGEIYIREDETDADGNVVGSSYKLINKDDLSPEEQESIEESIAGQLADRQEQQEQIEQIPVSESVHVYNLLFIGVDLRAGQNWNGNSDSMILISINSNTHQIYMTSFMRDLYVNIPGIGYDKLNRAHALGGGPLLIQTIEQNFRIHIDNYATVNFYSLISIIDAIGGIDMTISADEATVANGYISEMCAGNGLSPESYYLSGGGTVHLNGMQAVAYSRIRYVGNADFGRTERQRMVLMQMFAKLQNNPGQVTAFLNTALPLVTHNIPQNVVTSLIVNAPSYLGYQLVSQRVPFDGTYSYAGEMLVPDFNYTISMLQATLYQ